MQPACCRSGYGPNSSRHVAQSALVPSLLARPCGVCCVRFLGTYLSITSAAVSAGRVGRLLAWCYMHHSAMHVQFLRVSLFT